MDNKMIRLLLILLVFSCSSNKSDSFDWLIGTWIRTNGNPEVTVIETWTKKEGEYRAIALILKENDTIYRENITLSKKGASYFYQADVSQNDQPTLFRIMEVSPGSFFATKQDHDFPKEISYVKKGKFLEATISGNDKKVVYEFEKLE